MGFTINDTWTDARTGVALTNSVVCTMGGRSTAQYKVLTQKQIVAGAVVKTYVITGTFRYYADITKLHIHEETASVTVATEAECANPCALLYAMMKAKFNATTDDVEQVTKVNA